MRGERLTTARKAARRDGGARWRGMAAPSKREGVERCAVDFSNPPAGTNRESRPERRWPGRDGRANGTTWASQVTMSFPPSDGPASPEEADEGGPAWSFA